MAMVVSLRYGRWITPCLRVRKSGPASASAAPAETTPAPGQDPALAVLLSASLIDGRIDGLQFAIARTVAPRAPRHAAISRSSRRARIDDRPHWPGGRRTAAAGPGARHHPGVRRLGFDVGQIDGVAKITIAREVVQGLLDDLPAERRLGLVAYGHNRKGDCGDIQTLVPVG